MRCGAGSMEQLISPNPAPTYSCRASSHLHSSSSISPWYFSPPIALPVSTTTTTTSHCNPRLLPPLRVSSEPNPPSRHTSGRLYRSLRRFLLSHSRTAHALLHGGRPAAGSEHGTEEDYYYALSSGGGIGALLLSTTAAAAATTTAAHTKAGIAPYVRTLAGNQTFVSGLLSWALAQTIKFLLKFVVDRKWDLRVLFGGSGGMPSSHSALCTALTTSVALCHGVADSLFPVCLGFSLIVMYDATGVRRHAGLQAARCIWSGDHDLLPRGRILRCINLRRILWTQVDSQVLVHQNKPQLC